MNAAISPKALETLADIRQEKINERDARMKPLWEAIAPFVSPQMANWNDGDNEEEPDTGTDIYDSSAISSSNLYANGIQGWGFGRSMPWFRYAPEDSKYQKMSGVMAYLQNAESIRYTRFGRSNFYDEGRIFTKSVGDFGTGIMVRTTIDAQQTYRTLHLKRCCIMENQAGLVDALFYDFWLTPYQAAQEFGEENQPDTILDAYKNNRQKRFKFINYLFPIDKFNIDFDRKRLAKGKAFASIIVPDVDRRMVSSAGGNTRKNFYVWRWASSMENMEWGVDNPGLIAIGDIKQANGLRKEYSRGVQLAFRPPVKATEKARGSINLTPNGISYLKNGADFAPVQVVGNLPSLAEDIHALQSQIAKAYQTDIFLILTQNIERMKTATEVNGLQGEKAALMAAYIGRLTSEFLEPAIEDGFQDDFENGLLGEAPGMLKGQDFRIDMISPLAAMQKQALGLEGNRRFLAEAAQIAALKPEALDMINLDEYLSEIAAANNVSKKVVREVFQVEKMRAARAQAQAGLMQQQMQAQNATTAADVYQKTAKAPEEGSPAEARR